MSEEFKPPLRDELVALVGTGGVDAAVWAEHVLKPPRTSPGWATLQDIFTTLRTLFTTFVKNYCKSGNNDSHEGVESCIEEEIALFLGDPTGDAPITYRSRAHRCNLNCEPGDAPDDGYGASGFPLAADLAADGAPSGGARNPARFLKSVSASAKITIIYAHFLVEKYPNLGVSN
ncbi:hypothetical protein T492DRAFT_1149093 [Pavlovales sp. CCMP2436]|nr:hypothetical protein T492DRAFT_1149093 [Pavlovales sp. CCMP2436]